MCLGPDGKLHPNAKAVAAYLASYCNADGSHSFPRSGPAGQGPVDPLAMAREAGRREVFDLLARMLVLTIEDRHNLEDPLK